MAAYHKIKNSHAHLVSIRLVGTQAISFEFRYHQEGSKHITFTTHHIEVSLCDMKKIGKRFHEILADLARQWHQLKDAISGDK